MNTRQYTVVRLALVVAFVDGVLAEDLITSHHALAGYLLALGGGIATSAIGRLALTVQ